MTNEQQVRAGQAGQQPVIDCYGRLSRVPDTGELEKIDTQLADCRTAVGRSGGVVGEELSDGLSAWKEGVRRKGWERLLERARSGQSQGIAVWHTDRLFRRPKDLETLIALADSGFLVISAHGARDLSNPDDRFILRIEVAHAARSSDDTSRRGKRRKQTLREQGKPNGGRAFGFPRKDKSWTPGKNETEADRPTIPVAQIEQERAALKSAADDLLLGISPNVIAVKWNKAGLRTVSGRLWTGLTVRDTMQRATLAGRIEHEGVVVARMEGEQILTDEVFHDLRAMFNGRRRGRVAGERYLASGIMVCGHEGCGRPVSGRPHAGVYSDTGEKRRQYHCSKQRHGCGKVAADARAVDTQLRALTIARLSDSRHMGAITAARAQVADRLAFLTAEIAKRVKLQEGLAVRLGNAEMDLDAFDKANKPLAAKLAELRAEQEQLSGGVPEGPVTAMSADEVARQWDAGDVAEKRAMLVNALGTDTLVLLPAARAGKRTFDTNRVRAVKREPTVTA